MRLNDISIQSWPVNSNRGRGGESVMSNDFQEMFVEMDDRKHRTKAQEK